MLAFATSQCQLAQELRRGLYQRGPWTQPTQKYLEDQGSAHSLRHLHGCSLSAALLNL